ncbi:MAG: TIM barrel protein [Candidatus Eisenbacteria bacterium]|nr:TIM barrel protein [Candidatus Eisenbacteria bacterium]
MLRFGTSGIPLTSARPATEHGIRRARELGLDCLEMAWVNGVRMKPESADRIAAAAREHRLELTAHAPYYVNLCGADDVRERSLDRLENAGALASRCGAHSFCFHAGFYGKLTEAEAQRRVLDGLRQVTARLRSRGITVDVRPELTGRVSQLGSLEHLLDWCTAVPGVRPCIDFSHHYARLQGEPNRYEAFRAVLGAVRSRLGDAALERLHVHVSGIEFGPRGERRHLPLRESAFRYRELLRALKDENVSGWVVSESPEMEDDALRLQRAFRRLR